MEKQTWYNELGFEKNPFSIKPTAIEEIIGNQKKVRDLTEKIRDSNIILIYGEYGAGKTTILKSIIKEFKGKRKVIYYNCNQNDRSVDFDKLLTNVGLFRRIFRIKKKNMILFLDESQDLNLKDMERIKDYFYKDFFKSVVLVSKQEDLKLTDELNALIGDNKFKINSLNRDDAIKIVRKRIDDKMFISDNNIARIFAKNKNPRGFLKNCEDVCKYAFEKGKQAVSEEDIREVLEK